VRNCGPYLDKVLFNIEKIGSLFDDYKIVVYYDKSIDNSLSKLMNFQKRNPRLVIHVNETPTSPYRTHRLASARNHCLEYVKQHKDDYPLFIMMDFDDVNAKYLKLEILKKYVSAFEKDKEIKEQVKEQEKEQVKEQVKEQEKEQESQWDALSFNTSPKYYDIWALSIYPYCFSYNHFPNSEFHNYTSIQNYIENKLNNVKPGELLQCISSFNGFSLYRTEKFINSKYDGNVRFDLLPKKCLLAHMIASKSYKMVFPDFGHVKALYEDCEHRSFHIHAINKENAKIMISPEKLFV
jgi:hypothetical protein